MQARAGRFSGGPNAAFELPRIIAGMGRGHNRGGKKSDLAHRKASVQRRPHMATRTAAPRPATAEPGLARYLAAIRQYPMLAPEQEYLLAKRWREQGDRDAARQLVTSHLRLAAKIAMGFRGYGLPMSEMVSEANLGLIKAIERFEPDEGFRLSTYAIWWIRAQVQQYVLSSWSLVRVGSSFSQRKLFFKLRAAKRRIAAFEANLRPDQVALIAQDLGVPEQAVVEMDQRLDGDLSLNSPLRDDDGSAEWQDRLVDEGVDQETALAESEETDIRRTALHEALRVLNDRERCIFVGRRLSDVPITIETLAQRFGVSNERVRQIEIRAFQKVQNAVKGRVARHDDPPARFLPLSHADAPARHASLA
jgi:RNA polymerase sigma-32 factor